MPPDDVVEIQLDRARVLRIQRLDGLLKITSGFLVKRAATDALAIIGTVTLPLAKLDDLLQAVRKVGGSR
jgi:hypothetical protein